MKELVNYYDTVYSPIAQCICFNTAGKLLIGVQPEDDTGGTIGTCQWKVVRELRAAIVEEVCGVMDGVGG